MTLELIGPPPQGALPPYIESELHRALDAISIRLTAPGQAQLNHKTQIYLSALRKRAGMLPTHASLNQGVLAGRYVKLKENMFGPTTPAIPVFPAECFAALFKPFGRLRSYIAALDRQIFDYNAWEVYFSELTFGAYQLAKLSGHFFGCTTFENFPRLPPELRRRVWRLAAQQDQLVGISEVRDGAGYRLIGSDVVSALLRASFESRQIVLQATPDTLLDTTQVEPQSLTRLNFTNSILFLLTYNRINDRDPRPAPNPWGGRPRHSTLSLLAQLPQSHEIRRLAVSYTHCFLNRSVVGGRIEYSQLFRMSLEEIVFVIDRGSGSKYSVSTSLFQPTTLPSSHNMNCIPNQPPRYHTWTEVADAQAAHLDAAVANNNTRYAQSLLAGATPEALLADNLFDLSSWKPPRFVFMEVRNKTAFG